MKLKNKLNNKKKLLNNKIEIKKLNKTNQNIIQVNSLATHFNVMLIIYLNHCPYYAADRIKFILDIKKIFRYC
jgi:hypothetical protein